MRKIHKTRIIVITAIWTLLGFFLTVYDILLLNSHLSSGPHQDYNFGEAFIFNVLSGFLGGLMGAIVLTYVNRRYSDKPFYTGLSVVVFSFIVIVSIITFLGALIPSVISYSNPFSNPEAKAHFWKLISTTMHLKNIIFWAIVVAITHFSIQVSNKFGPGNLWKILTGKYHLPIHENRVFMFIDLKSSTATAEKLGGEKYHQLLKDIFSDITRPIINNQAEIYQYVGDEVVISWSTDKIKDKNQYLNCFFEIQEKLEEKAPKYLDKYNLIPEFKAGAHYGEVVAGEVGIIKRDITYSGDVLNTTARIQGKCNILNSSFLISQDLYRYVQTVTEHCVFQSKGEIPLKGKEHNLELISVEKM